MSAATTIVARLLENDEADDFIAREITDKPLPKSIALVGRRWFRRGPGNTYHTCEIFVDGKPVHKTPMQYGYGDQYTESGCKWLEDNFVIPKREHYSNGGHEAHWRHIRDKLGIDYSYQGIDVPRQRDL